MASRSFRCRSWLALCAALLLALAPSGSWANPRYAALVWDLTSGEILFARAPHERRYPASLAKMMTLFVLFEELERGRVRLDTQLPVTPHAEAQPALKLGLSAGESITVEHAIQALVTQSSNDVAVVIAEAIEGTEAAFAQRMTRTARALGMGGTQFRNASGLPDPDQHTTAWDMAVLGAALQVRFPERYRYFQTEAFAFRGRTYTSHNRVLRDVEGADGVKTGYIRASGFNLVTSVRREGRKIVGVVMGGRTARSRDAHMQELVEEHLPRAEVGQDYADLVVAAVRRRPATRDYVVQVGEASNAKAALTALQELQTEHDDLLGGLTPMLERSGDRVRARLAGFASREEALEACNRLRAKDVLCRIEFL